MGGVSVPLCKMASGMDTGKGGEFWPPVQIKKKKKSTSGNMFKNVDS